MVFLHISSSLYFLALTVCIFRIKTATDSAAKWATCSGANWANDSNLATFPDERNRWTSFLRNTHVLPRILSHIDLQGKVGGRWAILKYPALPENPNWIDGSKAGIV